MHILLLILKIIGILLLILLGLLLLFVLAVLFAPVRYRADGTLLEKKEADISANWLLFVLRVACSIKNGEVTACVRLFGIPVFTYPKRKKQKEKQTDTKLLDETIEIEKEIAYFTEEKKNDADSVRKLPELPENDPKEQKTKQKAKHRKKRDFRRMLTGIWQKLKQIIKNLAHIKEMIYDESNRSAFSHGCAENQYLLRHFGPRKLKADLTFATGDPARTGQLLGVICIFPVIYRNEVSIVPDFETDDFYIRGTFSVKGRIRLVHALGSGIRIWRDKNIRKIIRKIRK